MADYTYKFNLFGLPPVDMDVLIANSTTMMVGDPVHFEDGDVADRGAATEPLGGFCVGIVSKNGIPLELVSTDDYDGTYTKGKEGTGQYVASADNQTDKQVKARVRVTPGDVYSDVPDADIGTTAGSDSKGYNTDIVTGANPNPDENTATTGTAQLAIIGVDPSDSTRGLYMIKESQFLAV